MLELLAARSRPGDRGAIWMSVIVLIAGWSSPAAAALLVYESFDYEDGTVLHTTPATGQNLTGAYQSLEPGFPNQFQLSAQSPGLDYGNLISVPTATHRAAVRCSQRGTRSQPNSRTPRNVASRKNAVSTS